MSVVFDLHSSVLSDFTGTSSYSGDTMRNVSDLRQQRIGRDIGKMAWISWIVGVDVLEILPKGTIAGGELFFFGKDTQFFADLMTEWFRKHSVAIQPYRSMLTTRIWLLFPK